MPPTVELLPLEPTQLMETERMPTTPTGQMGITPMGQMLMVRMPTELMLMLPTLEAMPTQRTEEATRLEETQMRPRLGATRPAATTTLLRAVARELEGMPMLPRVVVKVREVPEVPEVPGVLNSAY